MYRAFRIAFHACIMLSLAVFVGCSDDDPTTPPNPGPEPTVAGSIGIYADDAGTNRDITDTGGTVTLYVFHKVTDGATATQFRIEEPAGWNLIGVNNQIELSLGDVENGIAYAYGSCLSGTIHLATLTYQSPGNSAGSSFKVVEESAAYPLQIIDCNQNRVTDLVGLTSMVTAP